MCPYIKGKPQTQPPFRKEKGIVGKVSVVAN